MKETIFLFAIFFVIPAYSAIVFARGADIPPGPVDGQPDWPAGLAELVSRDERVNGYMGDKARDFRLTSANGETINLSDFKGKNIVVMGVGNPYT
jgi:hypothetical protein